MNRSDLMICGVTGALAAIGVAAAVRSYRGRVALPGPFVGPTMTIPPRLENTLVLTSPSGLITMDDATHVRRQLETLTGPIRVVIHSLGGLLLASMHIAHSLKLYPGAVTAYVPHYAMSGGTMVALAADEIVMDRSAILGPVDPLIEGHPAATVDQLLRQKPVETIGDEWYVRGLESRKVLGEVRELVQAFVASPAAVERLVSGERTHTNPITLDEARVLGLPVREGVPREVAAVLEATLRHQQQAQALCMPRMTYLGPRGHR